MLLPATCLLAGLLPSLVHAQAKANLDIWNIDSSCTNYPKGGTSGGGVDYTSYLQAGFTDALLNFQAAKASLEIALKKRPDEKTDTDGYNEWVRISDSIFSTLGIAPKKDKEESATDEYWTNVFKPLDKGAAALPSTQNNPAKGYNPELFHLANAKPMVVCGEENWQWIAMDGKIPGTDMLLKDLPKGKIAANIMEGAWFLQHRFIWQKTKQESGPALCGENVLAQTYFQQNFIMICPTMFSNDIVKLDSLKDVKSSQNKIKALTPISEYMKTLGSVLTHELFHFYGGIDESAPTTFKTVITDGHAVNEKGYPLYYDTTTKKVTSTPKAFSSKYATRLGLVPVPVYGIDYIFNLARSYTRTDSEVYSGPSISTKVADSLTMFSDMMLLDGWNWAEAGLARPPKKLTKRGYVLNGRRK